MKIQLTDLKKRQEKLDIKNKELQAELNNTRLQYKDFTKKIIAFPSDNWGCGNYRIIQPYANLSSILPNVALAKPTQLKLALNQQFLSQFDIVVNQRTIDNSIYNARMFYKNITPELLKQLNESLVQANIEEEKRKEILSREVNKVFIQEIDDDLQRIAPHNPSYKTYKKGSKFLETFLKSIREADHVTVTTPVLRQVYARLNKNIQAFNNAIETRHFLLRSDKSRRLELPDDKIIIGYQGGSSHLKDIPLFKRALKQILEEYPHVHFAFCSSEQFFDYIFGKDLPKDQVHIIPPVQSNFNFFVNLPSMFDIGLAPVENVKFNDGKSYLKILEYGIWSIPTIASKVECYNQFNDGKSTSGVTLVKNKHSHWYKAMKNLVEDQEMRIKSGEDLLNLILEDHNLDLMNKRRAEWLTKL